MHMRAAVIPLAILATSFAASRAHANHVDPKHCTLQGPFIDVEGNTNGLPDDCADGRCADYTIVIRDFAGNPSAGVTVTIDFSECADIQVACDQLNAVTGQSYVAGKKVAQHTDSQGRALFRVQGAANASTPGAPGTLMNVACAHVDADGYSLSPALIVAAYDVNGTGSPGGAVSGADVALVAAEAAHAALGQPAYARDDYNHSGTVNGADVARAAAMAGDAALGSGSQTTGPACP